MRLEIKKKSILIIPENEQDEVFILDSLGLKDNKSFLKLERVNDVSMGFNSDKFVLKAEKND